MRWLGFGCGSRTFQTILRTFTAENESMKKRSHANADLTPFPEVLNISAVKKREQNKNKFMSSILKKMSIIIIIKKKKTVRFYIRLQVLYIAFMIWASMWKSMALLENSAHRHALGVRQQPFGELLSAHHLIQQLWAGGALLGTEILRRKCVLRNWCSPISSVVPVWLRKLYLLRSNDTWYHC